MKDGRSHQSRKRGTVPANSIASLDFTATGRKRTKPRGLTARVSAANQEKQSGHDQNNLNDHNEDSLGQAI